MKIGELAGVTNTTPETIRFYEKKGLLPAPERTEGNYRHYHQFHVDRLRFIRNCRSLDMNHEEIRALIALAEQPAASCEGVNTLLNEHIGHVEARIAELQQLKSQLLHISQRCQVAQSVDGCGILQGLSALELTEEGRTGHTHLG
ncbi:Cd(II)/Pb(II)-responsive transcriptional regulator [Musicola paradisiaca]|uniref:Transcriptional regulator, MerR family n=1 Tax=Musicola paradisiaca (strain Ech703) TaxID=579405 RepID=C6C3A6_MUSP7|nr:Cd(II)/Pb(II)-responsive transcriptional regulator [Musicola paradisiaca]ACS87204.1 transcriptional regulator, MerR family [Musicola paradisiaca Ech703]